VDHYAYPYTQVHQIIRRTRIYEDISRFFLFSTTIERRKERCKTDVNGSMQFLIVRIQIWRLHIDVTQYGQHIIHLILYMMEKRSNGAVVIYIFSNPSILQSTVAKRRQRWRQLPPQRQQQQRHDDSNGTGKKRDACAKYFHTRPWRAPRGWRVIRPFRNVSQGWRSTRRYPDSRKLLVNLRIDFVAQLILDELASHILTRLARLILRRSFIALIFTS